MSVDNIDEAIEIAIDTLIKPFEGYAVRLPNGNCKAYPDPGTGGKPWTIGWGSTGSNIGPSTEWTEEQAQEALEDHVRYFCKGVLSLCPNLEDVSPLKLAAIISFAYNVGLGNLKISTLRKRILENDWEGASKEILKWNKAAGRILAGLSRRRQAESILLKI